MIAPSSEVFESLHEEAERLVRLAASLEATARGEAGEAIPRPVDVVAAAQAAVEAVRPMLERRSIRSEVHMPETAVALVDPDHLGQVLSNLLHNAARYVDDGGQVSVAIESMGRRVITTVVNSGPGIPPDDLDRVFERFYRVDKSRDRATGGAGIGLAIVRTRLQAAGGDIAVESRRGRTSFTFWLPKPEPGAVATLVPVDGQSARLRAARP